MKIKCDKCENDLEELGALAFSPPDAFSTVDKYHICRKCWSTHIFPNFHSEVSDDVDAVTFQYVNWKGVKSKRHVIPISIFFGSNRWHKERQWLMEAYDLDKQAMRTFAMECVNDWKQ